jgi:hypothetical protein
VRRAEGHELDEAAEALVPTTAIGHLLEPDGAAKLIRRIERGIPKRPAAAWMWRAVKRKRGLISQQQRACRCRRCPDPALAFD